MFPSEILFPYCMAVLLVVVAPGPDNILAISRGLSQGALAGFLSSAGAGMGIMFHTLAVVLGLAIVLQTSPVAFWLIKMMGAVYLLWLGYNAIFSRNLIVFNSISRQPLFRIFMTGLLSNLLNPKPGLFVIAFLPQFVSLERGSIPVQLVVYGAIFAVLTVIIFSLLGCFAGRLSGWLARKPKVVAITNLGAGCAFVVAGMSILTLEHRQ